MRRRRAKGLHNGGPAKFGYRLCARRVRAHRARAAAGGPPHRGRRVRRIMADLEAGVSQKSSRATSTARACAPSAAASGTRAPRPHRADPFYCGLVRWRTAPSWRARQPAIIDRATWERVQVAVAARRLPAGAATAGGPQRPALFLHGHLRCGTCGGPMATDSRNASTVGRAYTLGALRCANRERERPLLPDAAAAPASRGTPSCTR